MGDTSVAREYGRGHLLPLLGGSFRFDIGYVFFVGSRGDKRKYHIRQNISSYAIGE